MGEILHLRRLDAGRRARGHSAMLRRAGSVFRNDGLPEVGTGTNVEQFKNIMVCKLGHACNCRNISELDFVCGMCSVTTFGKILAEPEGWLKRNFCSEYKLTENPHILAEVANTALFFYTLAKKLPPELAEELLFIGSYFFQWNHFLTGKVTALHLHENFREIAEIFRDFFRSFFYSHCGLGED